MIVYYDLQKQCCNQFDCSNNTKLNNEKKVKEKVEITLFHIKENDFVLTTLQIILILPRVNKNETKENLKKIYTYLEILGVDIFHVITLL